MSGMKNGFETFATVPAQLQTHASPSFAW